MKAALHFAMPAHHEPSTLDAHVVYLQRLHQAPTLVIWDGGILHRTQEPALVLLHTSEVAKPETPKLSKDTQRAARHASRRHRDTPRGTAPAGQRRPLRRGSCPCSGLPGARRPRTPRAREASQKAPLSSKAKALDSRPRAPCLDRLHCQESGPPCQTSDVGASRLSSGLAQNCRTRHLLLAHRESAHGLMQNSFYRTLVKLSPECWPARRKMNKALGCKRGFPTVLWQNSLILCGQLTGASSVLTRVSQNRQESKPGHWQLHADEFGQIARADLEIIR